MALERATLIRLAEGGIGVRLDAVRTPEDVGLRGEAYRVPVGALDGSSSRSLALSTSEFSSARTLAVSTATPEALTGTPTAGCSARAAAI